MEGQEQTPRICSFGADVNWKHCACQGDKEQPEGLLSSSSVPLNKGALAQLSHDNYWTIKETKQWRTGLGTWSQGLSYL